MHRFNILVATTSPDIKAEVIAERIAAHPAMNLLCSSCVAAADVLSILDAIPVSPQSAVVLVGGPSETDELAQQWLTKRPNLVVMLVDVMGDIVRIAVRDPRLDSLLAVLLGLMQRGDAGSERVARVQLRVVKDPELGIVLSDRAIDPRPLLQAAIAWIHKRLRDAVAGVSDENGDVHGLSVSSATLLQLLDTAVSGDESHVRNADDADTTLDRALAAADPVSEPLVRAATAFGLSRLEFRMLLLGLAPELDVLFQRCIGFLLDDVSRRVGTSALYASLLGPAVEVRRQLAESDALAEWLVFDRSVGHQAAADEGLRIDPYLAQWLLGERNALAGDPRVRRVLHLQPWAGAALVDSAKERGVAADVLWRLRDPDASPWLLLGGDAAAWWRAVLERGAGICEARLIRVEVIGLGGMDIVDVEECARRLGRMTRLTGDALVFDDTQGEATQADDTRQLAVFLETLNHTHAHAAVIYRDEARIVRGIGNGRFELVSDGRLPVSEHVASVRAAGNGAGVYLTDETAGTIAARYPLQLDGLEQAMRLASSRPLNYDISDPRLSRFTAACKEVAAESISHLADRIEPIFNLDDVVLPADRKDQLVEIVEHVRLASYVLDEWKFREQLPYGRGVTALFVGPSGTGKTMAAIGIARRLGIQILRFDLSRVVSKYIGDTEKNIDRVFTDAHRSGAAVLMDEADALLGKRSEVKDAHDRYANIEVAYLLQRLEGHAGPVFLTTNLRQSIDQAFLRRIRFIIDFPRPDADAREKIWRQCLPDGSHALDDKAFRLLGRRIDVTGGHIRQITLRAAFIAAAAGTLINLEHISHATRNELAKLGMPAVDLDLGSGRQAA